MRFRTTLVLVLAFIALGAYVGLVELNKKPEQSPADKALWILTLGKDDVTELEVADGEKSIFFARQGDKWYVGGIGGSEADEGRVNSVVASLVDLRSSRIITEAEGLATYGLESPKARVRLGLTGGKSETLLIGDKTPQGSAYYIQRQGSPTIYTAWASLFDDLKGFVATPPYKPTPTPQPSPLETPAPTPGTVGPAPSPTP